MDYVKTGVEAEMDKRLAPRKWPHFMEKSGKASYHSFRILGQLYDKVDKVDFKPTYDVPFDRRVLTKYKLSTETLRKARKIKSQYDAALRRVMGQLEVKTEFEIWAAFVLSRPRVGTQYKFHEIVRRESDALKEQYRNICVKEAGGSRDVKVAGPFAAAMYQVTWEEVQIALYESRTSHIRPDGTVGKRPVKSYSMPLISFPWLLERTLGDIATGSTLRKGRYKLDAVDALKPKPRPVANTYEEGDQQSMADMDYARTNDGQIIHRGEILHLFDHDDEDSDFDSESLHDSLSSPEPPSMVDSDLLPENESQPNEGLQAPKVGEAVYLPSEKAPPSQGSKSGKSDGSTILRIQRLWC